MEITKNLIDKLNKWYIVWPVLLDKTRKVMFIKTGSDWNPVSSIIKAFADNIKNLTFWQCLEFPVINVHNNWGCYCYTRCGVSYGAVCCHYLAVIVNMLGWHAALDCHLRREISQSRHQAEHAVGASGTRGNDLNKCNWTAVQIAARHDASIHGMMKLTTMFHAVQHPHATQFTSFFDLYSFLKLLMVTHLKLCVFTIKMWKHL